MSSDYKKATIESYDKTVNDYIAKVDALHLVKESAKFLLLLEEYGSLEEHLKPSS